MTPAWRDWPAERGRKGACVCVCVCVCVMVHQCHWGTGAAPTSSGADYVPSSQLHIQQHHKGSWTPAMVRPFTPQELAMATNQRAGCWLCTCPLLTVCVFVRGCLCRFVSVHVSVHVSVRGSCMSVCLSVCVYVCMCTSVGVYVLSVCVSECTCMSLCVGGVYMCVCVSLCVSLCLCHCVSLCACHHVSRLSS